MTTASSSIERSPGDEKRRSSVQAAPGLASEEDAAVLAKMGYKQELRRNFSVLEIFGIAFSIMGLLPSIASTLAYSIPAGPVGLVWGWFLPSGLIFVVGLAMSDLGSAMPTSGGLYFWTHYFSSPKTRNALSFLVGYSNTLGLVGGLCSIDYGFALQFLAVIVLARDGEWAPTNGVIYGTFLATVLFHGVCASSFARLMGKYQSVSSFLQLVLIVATVIALPIGASKRHDAEYIFTKTANLTQWPTGWTFMLSWLSAIWTIGGFDSCVHLSEEASNAVKAVPIGILASIGCCWVFGWVCVIVIAAVIDPDLSKVTGTKFGQPMAQIYYDCLGKNGALGFMSLLMICQFMMGVSILIAASRQAWAFSRDGALPFSNFLRHISASFGYIPLRTIWFCVILAALMGLLTLIDAAAAQAVFSLGVVGNNLAWGTPIFSRLVWGQERFKPGPFYLGRASKPVGWLAVIFLVFGTLLGMFPVEGPNPTKNSMNYTVVIAGAVWGGALLYYFVDARKWFTGPKITLRDDILSEEEQVKMREEGLNIEVQVDGNDKDGDALKV